MKNSNKLDDIIRNFTRTIHEEIGYPNVSSQPVAITGLGQVDKSETPPAFQGKLELQDAVDALFYHFSVLQIVDAMASHIQTKAEGLEDMDERENMIEIVATLKQLTTKVKM